MLAFGGGNLAGADGVSEWPVEDIPDTAELFMRVLHNHIEDGKPMPGAFRVRGEEEQQGMSTDWNKYSTPIETRNRIRQDRSATEYGVLGMNVGVARSVPNQAILHAPIVENRAHTNVTGPIGAKNQKTEIRLRFMQISYWVIEWQP